jgi:peptidoglycan/LPS O-acetylase OafA/YrhL
MIFPFLRYVFLKYKLFAILLCVLISLLVEKFYHFEMSILRFPLYRLLEFVLGMSFIYLFNASRKCLNLILIGIVGALFYLTIGLNIPIVLHLAIEGICIFTCLACISEFLDNLILRRVIGFMSKYSYGAFLVHHVMFYQILPFFKTRHLNLFNSYLLFSMLLLIIYSLSFLLTNVTSFCLTRVTAEIQ